MIFSIIAIMCDGTLDGVAHYSTRDAAEGVLAEFMRKHALRLEKENMVDSIMALWDRENPCPIEPDGCDEARIILRDEWDDARGRAETRALLAVNLDPSDTYNVRCYAVVSTSPG